MGSIVTRKGPQGTKYQAHVRRKGHPARVKTFSSRTRAQKWITRVEAAIEERRDLPHREALKHSVSEMVPLYLDGEGFAKLSGTEQRKRANHLRRWVELLGEIPVAELTSANIKAARRRLKAEGGKGRPISSATANRYMASLSKFCSWLIGEGLLNENPARSAKVERGPERKRDRVLSPDERQRLLDVARDVDPILHALIVLALTTGGRQGEILGLTWREVDLDGQRVRFLRTKNGEPRSVPLPEPALVVLRKLAKVRHMDRSVFGGIKFPLQSWRRVLRRAKIEDLRYHDLRHSYATALAEAGATLSELRHALGHKTLSQVLRYQHLTERATEDRIRERLEGVELA